MRTSEEIYHRVRWDARFDPARFVLGVHQRGAAAKRVPLPEFAPGGEVPWHRVLFIEADGELVWDRATGTDRLDSCAAGRARLPLLLRAPFFTARTPFAWDPVAAQWRVARTAEAGAVTDVELETAAGAIPAAATVRVLTWNTLWDRYDPGLIATARRRPLLLAALQEADADVVALQEVESGLLRMLLDAPWVRARYTLDTGPAGRDSDDCGLLLLSRLPVREAARHSLGPHKAVAALTVDTAAGPLVVAATHLSSDHSSGGPARRKDQLARLTEGLRELDADVVLLGDFNDGRDGPSGPAAVLAMRDAWTEAHGAADRTPTFDPTVNPLAAVSSLTGRASRLDRVLLRAPGASVTAARLVGDAPSADGLHPSDHFGVRADLRLGAAPAGLPGGDAVEVLDVPPTARTALAWIPPDELWPPLQELRRAHDPRFDRWPPHVNVLFGFVPESHFERAAPLLAAAAAEVPAFTARLAGVDTFGHREDATIWLDPAADGDAAWAALRSAFQRRFPNCRGRDEGYIPHLTLGRSRDPRRTATECAAKLTATTARVGELVLLSRRADEPMRVRATVELGTGELRWWPESGAGDEAAPHRAPQAPAGQGLFVEDGTARRIAGHNEPHTGGAHPRPAEGSRTAAPDTGAGGAHPREPHPRAEQGPLAPDTASDARARRIAARIGEALGEAAVHVVGSRAMGCHGAGADLDLVAAVPGGLGAEEAAARVAALPGAGRVRQVREARVPGLRFTVEGLAVDVVVVPMRGVPVGEAVERRAEEGEAAAVALSAVSDAGAVRAATDGLPAFPRLARQVKAWARARGLDAAPFGGLPGLAWAVLAARTAREAGPSAGPGTDLAARFFGAWAAWDWREQIALVDGNAGPTPRSAVTLLTPSAPVRSCTEQVTEGIRDLLTQELYQAWETVEAAAATGADPWPALLSPAPLHRRHAAWAVLTVRPVPGEDFEATLGRFRGRVRSLITALEDDGTPDAHAWPRPFAPPSTAPQAVRYAIGLGRTPPDASLLDRLARPWSRRVPGVDVTWAESGAVPSLR